MGLPPARALQGGDEGSEEGLQARQQAPRQAERNLGILTQFGQRDAKTLLHRPTPFGRCPHLEQITIACSCCRAGWPKSGDLGYTNTQS